jgi:hypothetical protein
MGKISIAPTTAAFLLAGCAIHPVPEDVTGVTTYQIARQIRCETREAAKERVLTEIRTLAEGSPYQAGDPVAQRLLARYGGDDGEDISTFSPALFPGADYALVRAYLNTIYSTAVAYSFDLTMDETNNLGTVLDWLGPWFTKFALNATADANRERSNEEVFTLTDTLGGLLMNLSAPQHGVPYCGPQQLVQANYIYPIAGKIGVNKTVKTFFELSTFTSLGATPASTKSGNAAQNAPTYTEKLIFTTTLDASANPKLTFTPVGKKFQFMDASITGLAKRMDTHKVYVALAEQPSGTASLTLLQNYLFPAPAISTFTRTSRQRVSTAFLSTGVAIGNSVIAKPRTSGEALALEAVDQMRSREIQITTIP